MLGDLPIELPLLIQNPYRLYKGMKSLDCTQKNIMGKTVWVVSAAGKSKLILGTAFAQGPGSTWWVNAEGWGILIYLEVHFRGI